MSTKTIALESTVYEKLARVKRPSESFTKTINRLLDTASATSCGAAVTGAAEIWARIGNDAEADLMESHLLTTRKATDWCVEKPE